MTDENKKLMQDTIDRVLYCGDDYIERLKKLNEKYDPHNKVKYTHEPTEFRFPISAAI